MLGHKSFRGVGRCRLELLSLLGVSTNHSNRYLEALGARFRPLGTHVTLGVLLRIYCR